MKFSQLVTDTKEAADEIILAMNDQIKTHHYMTVGDLYLMMHQEPSWEDDQWGWKSTEGFTIDEINGKFSIKIPAPETLVPEGER